MKRWIRGLVLAVWFINFFSAFPVIGQEDKTNLNPSTPIGRLEWSAHFPNLGSFSSPRVTDLNGDSVGDIILGMGRLEFQAIDTAVVAINGANGHVLWHLPSNDQIFGSALLYDINKDGVEDIIIGGRSANLMAINGTNGKVLWHFVKEELKPFVQKKYFNFYNPQLIPDQNGDGISEILISNGGDVMKIPYEQDRPVGHLMVLDGSNGAIVQEAPMPDGNETYCSVALSSGENAEEIEVVFGTGGETLAGNLFVCTLREVLNGNLTQARKLASSSDKGFVAPPVWADINGDGLLDIVACSVDGGIFAFDGTTKKELWKRKRDDTEIYVSVGLGHFGRKKNTGIFVTANKGFWPFFTQSRQVMFDGRKGRTGFEEIFGEFQTSSPLVYDINGDGRDEIILSINFKETAQKSSVKFSNSIYVIDPMKKRKYPLISPLPGHNNSSTPWIGDLDGDGFLEVVFSHSNNPDHTYAFDGMQVNLLKTNIPVAHPPMWNTYMGKDLNGRYEP